MQTVLQPVPDDRNRKIASDFVGFYLGLMGVLDSIHSILSWFSILYMIGQYQYWRWFREARRSCSSGNWSGEAESDRPASSSQCLAWAGSPVSK